MIVVSDDSIKKALDRVNKLRPDKVSKFIKDFAERQPHVTAYTLAMSELLGDKVFAEDLHFHAIIVWQSFLIEGKKLPRVTDRAIMKNDDKMLNDFQSINGLDEEQAAMRILKNTRQANLVAFMSDAIAQIEDMPYHIQSQFFSTIMVIIESFDEILNGVKK